MSRQPITIGTFTVTETFTHQQSFETACNYRNFRIEPGTYAVSIYPSYPGNIGHSLYVTVPDAECTASYFENRIFQHRSANVDQDKGKRERVSFRLATFGDSVRDALEDGRLVITDPDVGVRRYASEYAKDGMEVSLSWRAVSRPDYVVHTMDAFLASLKPAAQVDSFTGARCW